MVLTASHVTNATNGYPQRCLVADLVSLADRELSGDRGRGCRMSTSWAPAMPRQPSISTAISSDSTDPRQLISGQLRDDLRHLYLQYAFLTEVTNSLSCGTAARIWPAVVLSTAPPFGIAIDVLASRSSACFAPAHARC